MRRTWVATGSHFTRCSRGTRLRVATVLLVGAMGIVVGAIVPASWRTAVLVVGPLEAGSRRRLLARRSGWASGNVLLVVAWRAALIRRCSDRKGGLGMSRVEMDVQRRRGGLT
uniref:Uncharacterized protein n=1 Tax=Arundo donax TaxID=35708 RepID=A0A0A9CUB3_ARUDO